MEDRTRARQREKEKIDRVKDEHLVPLPKWIPKLTLFYTKIKSLRLKEI